MELLIQCYTVDLARSFHSADAVVASPEIKRITLIAIGISITISYGKLKISSNDSPLAKEPPADADGAKGSGRAARPGPYST